MNNGPLFIIDSDLDDREFLEEAWKEIGYQNLLFFFKTAEEAIEQIETNPLIPFLIISEIYLPKMNGFELKKYLMTHHKTKLKSIPFVFLSANFSQEQVEEAYNLCTNGIFIKKGSIEKLKIQLVEIAKYWSESLVPM